MMQLAKHSTKLPSNIPKFDGKPGEDSTNHIMTFHIWCSSNTSWKIPFSYDYFKEPSRSVLKWYVDEKSGSHVTFESLAKSFLSFFQLPVHHDIGLEILSEF
jgi:hypothetical protein